MTSEAAMAAILAIALSALFLQVNVRTSEPWLKLLSIFAMLGFAGLAGYAIIKAILV